MESPAPSQPADFLGPAPSNAPCRAVRRHARLGASAALGVAAFSGLLFVAMFDGPLRIALNPAARSRAELGSTLTVVAIYPLAFLLVVAAAQSGGPRLWLSRRDLRNVALLALLPLSVTVTQVLQGGNYSRVGEALRLLETVAAYLVFRDSRVGPRTIRRVVVALFAAATLLTMGLSISFAGRGLITYSESLELGIGRPQIAGTLLQSTEMSNIAVEVLLLGLCVGVTSKTRLARVVTATASLPVAFLFVAMGSIGSYVCLAIVLGIQFLRRYRTQRRAARLLWAGAVALGALTLALLAGGRVAAVFRLFGDVLSGKIAGDVRVGMYAGLVGLVRGSPFDGIGLGRFFEATGYYPHHNLLGIWAELGAVCAVAYLVYVAMCLYWTADLTFARGKRRWGIDAEVAYTLCLIVLFLHLKGLVQDTWNAATLLAVHGEHAGAVHDPGIPWILSGKSDIREVREPVAPGSWPGTPYLGDASGRSHGQKHDEPVKRASAV